MSAYTYRSARSKGLVFGVGIVIVVETVGLHVLAFKDHPIVAWAMTFSTLSVLLWLVADYRAMGAGAVRTTPTEIDIRIGRRAQVIIARSNVAAAIHPTFRDLPQLGRGLEIGHLNLTKHMSPNVLLTLREPVPVSMAGIVKQPARQIAMHLDDPDAFLADVRP